MMKGNIEKIKDDKKDGNYANKIEDINKRMK